jgi:hypothetical protein
MNFQEFIGISGSLTEFAEFLNNEFQEVLGIFRSF